MLKRLTFALSCAALPDLAPTGAMAQLSIMTLGDSITQGGYGLASYRAPLIDLLNTNGYSGQFQMVGSMSQTANNSPDASAFYGQPNHEGHYGWRTDQILYGHNSPQPGSGSGNLSTWLAGYTPDIVLIHLGTNDAIQDAPVFNTSPDPDFAQTTWNEISSVISTIQNVNPLAHIFVAQIIPVRVPAPSTDDEMNPFLTQVQERIDALNNLIGSNATSLGSTIVDFRGLASDAEMLADSFHPNALGEAFMAERWFNAMESTGALSAIPEPSTYALIAGVSTLLCAALRRRRGQAARAA